MHKKLVAIAGVTILALTMAVSAYAVPISAPARAASTSEYGCGISGHGYGFMRDEDGNFLSREAFEKKLDAAVKDGTITAEQKLVCLERFDSCVSGEGFQGRGCGRGSGGCRR